MDKFKNFVNQHQPKLRFLFLVCAAVSCFNCLAKPDYNLVLYAYAYFVWNMMGNSNNSQSSEKLYCFWFMFITIFVDLIWIFYWGSLWTSLQKDDEAFIHYLVILMSWISFGIKIACTLMVGIGEWASIKSALPEKFQEHLNQYKEQKDDPNA